MCVQFVPDMSSIGDSVNSTVQGLDIVSASSMTDFANVIRSNASSLDANGLTSNVCCANLSLCSTNFCQHVDIRDTLREMRKHVCDSCTVSSTPSTCSHSLTHLTTPLV
jgi:hypothetical protein